jgi:hypothetical protein
LQATLLRDEILSLLDKKALEVVDPRTAVPGYYSHYFLAPRQGGWSPILNLSAPEHLLVQCDNFRMETLKAILAGLSPGDWMFSLDLKDAYLHVPIFPAHRKYLRFAFRNPQGVLIVYQWAVLPFGLSTSPRGFTKLVAPLMGVLHVEGHIVSPYIDDMHGLGRQEDQAILSRDACPQAFVDSGFLVNLL